MCDKIEWISVQEREPTRCFYEDERGFKYPVKYLVHEIGADCATTAEFLNGEFVMERTSSVLVIGDVDYWAEMPRWNHDK